MGWGMEFICLILVTAILYNYCWKLLCKNIDNEINYLPWFISTDYALVVILFDLVQKKKKNMQVSWRK